MAAKSPPDDPTVLRLARMMIESDRGSPLLDSSWDAIVKYRSKERETFAILSVAQERAFQHAELAKEILL